MNRILAAVLFILASLVGGPLVFLASTFAVVNLVNAAILFLPAIFDNHDFRFVIFVIPLAISVAIAYGILRGTMWLARRTVGASKSLLDTSKEYERSGRWLTVLLTLLAVSLVVAVVLGVWVSHADMATLLANDLGNEVTVVAVLIGAYMPLTLAVFSMGLARSSLQQPGSEASGSTIIAILACPTILIAWLVVQGFTGGLF